MQELNPKIETAQTIELPADVVDTIADELATRDAPTVDDARDLAHDHVEQRTEFVTERDEPLVDALKRRL